MMRSALPPAPLDHRDRKIVVPAAKLSAAQRDFIRASIRYAREYTDKALRNRAKEWNIEPSRNHDDHED